MFGFTGKYKHSGIDDAKRGQAVGCVLTLADVHALPVFVGRTDEVAFKLGGLKAGEGLLRGALVEEEPLHVVADVLQGLLGDHLNNTKDERAGIKITVFVFF